LFDKIILLRYSPARFDFCPLAANDLEEGRVKQMKTKAVVIGGPESLREAFSSHDFARAVLESVVEGILDVPHVLQRPAEYYVQEADRAPAISSTSIIGVEVRMTGISRNGRTAKQFHDALKKLEDIVENTVIATLPHATAPRCQVFCALMLDGDVETAPGSGVYSSIIEGKAFYAGE